MVGYLVNTVVLRTDTGGDPSFAELLSRVRSTALAAYGTPTPVRAGGERGRDPAQHVQHSAVPGDAVLRGRVAAVSGAAGLGTEVAPRATATAKFDLT